MIDVLARSGRLDEAETLLRSLSSPDPVALKAVLGACRIHTDVKRAERIAHQLLSLDPTDAATHVMLANIYAAAGRMEDSERIRQQMKVAGAKKTPGISTIEINGKQHSFVAADDLHPDQAAVREKLQEVVGRLRDAGHQFDTRWVTREAGSEEDREESLCTHSEKLAISYGLLEVPEGAPIRITKNLRVCPDCHGATKVISRVYKREIVVRDASRFHHFKDGACSCGDFW